MVYVTSSRLLEVLTGSSFKYLIVTLLCADLQFLSHPVLGDLLTEDDQQVPLLAWHAFSSLDIC